MSALRTHVVMPNDLVAEIDRIVGKRGRSEFIVHAAERELKRLQQIKALETIKGAWKDEDHPELKAGSAEWVRLIRREGDARVRRED
jgi:hypothetical protein